MGGGAQRELGSRRIKSSRALKAANETGLRNKSVWLNKSCRVFLVASVSCSQRHKRPALKSFWSWYESGIKRVKLRDE